MDIENLKVKCENKLGIRIGILGNKIRVTFDINEVKETDENTAIIVWNYLTNDKLTSIRELPEFEKALHRLKMNLLEDFRFKLLERDFASFTDVEYLLLNGVSICKYGLTEVCMNSFSIQDGIRKSRIGIKSPNRVLKKKSSCIGEMYGSINEFLIKSTILMDNGILEAYLDNEIANFEKHKTTRRS